VVHLLASPSGIEFRILGPLEVLDEGRAVALGGSKQRALLAVLLLHANEPLTTDRLIDELWGEHAPPTAAKAVHVHVSRLRKALTAGAGNGGAGEGPLVTRERGYEMRLEPERLDSNRFEWLLANARRELDAGNSQRALAALEEGLSLWRGEPLADLAYEPFAQAAIARLADLRVGALELVVEAKLALGRHAEVITQLEALIGEHPFRERLRAQLMLALYRSDRQADALQAYQDARRALVEELGIEPGERLRALERAILAQDPALAAPGLASVELPAKSDTRDGAGLAPAPEGLPTGVVTFLLTDIEGSSRLWESDADAMAAALELHDELVERSVNAHGGRLLKAKGEGDATLSVFRRASDAAASAVECQRALLGATWPGGLDLRVRVALHTGEAHEREGDYFGPALNRAARLRGLARGATTVASQATAEIVRDRLPHGAQLVDLGPCELPGLARPERVFELRAGAGVPQDERRTEPVRVVLPLPRPLRFAADAPFVGREAELGRLRKLWSEVSGGERAAAFLAGEAGIGKTRLVSELARALQEEGRLVLYGRCDEGLAVPYQPWVEALRPYATAIGPDRLRAELGTLAPQLGRLLPELEMLGVPARGDPESERFALFEAVSTLLEAATREQLALLVLDDLHWAAPPTLLLLRYLIRSERGLRTLMVGSYRETELDPAHPLAGLLADLQRDASAHGLGIRGLDEDGIAALLEAAAGHALDERAGGFVRLLHAETGGNPFFIREVLAHLAESGAIYRAGERWTTDLTPGQLEVPEGLRQVIRYRVARLSEPARRALGAGAVAGPSFTLTLLEAVLGDQAGLLEGLEQAASAGLLAEGGAGEYAFAHALVRQTIYAAHSSARRARLHRQLGEALEALGNADSHVEALAHHFAEAAADGQTVKAATYALSAGRQAIARLGYEDAATHYERGLDALERATPPDEARRCELLISLAEARWSSGEMHKAREAARLAAELADRLGEPERLARAALGFAGPVRFEVAEATTRPIIDLLERALTALGGQESALRARLLGRLAAVLTYSGRRRVVLAREGLEMARRAGDKPALAEVLAASYVAIRRPDNLDERGAIAKELARLAPELGEAALAALARNWILTELLERGDFEAAERELDALDRLAEESQQRFPRFIAANARARRAYLEGRLEDYEALADEVLALGQEGQDEVATHAFGVSMLFLRREQGRLGEVVETIESFAAGYPQMPAWRCALAWTFAELDRRPDARQELDALARNDFTDLPRDWLWLITMAILGEVAAFLDDARRAGLLYELLLPYADRCVVVDAAFCLGSASRPLGLLATTVGSVDAAVRHFQHALEFNARIKSPLCVAHTQHDYAQTLLRRDQPGDRENALTLLGAALATAEKLQLTALVGRAKRLKHQAETTASA
jgi:DNA-binding SARP family transcriptional activator